ncbi:hypothetical protein GCM10029964_115850 [Kibdelosporangium lantanae]
MRRPRLLDLCCKAGGASAGYHAAGFDVVGVDIEPQPDYPFPFIRADALTVDLSGFDVIAASPPCQRYSVATPTSRRDDHPDLLAPVRQRLQDAVATPGGPWAYVIENVPGAPLVDPVQICGDTLRLGVRRHRLFESNLPLYGTPCWHDRQTPSVPVYGTYGQRAGRDRPAGVSTDQARAAMGIDWMPWPALTQAIPPTFTYWLGVQLIAHCPPQTACDTSNQGASVTPDETHRCESSPSDGRPAASIMLRHCRCGQPLPPRPTTGRWPRYCSHACRQAAYRVRRVHS